MKSPTRTMIRKDIRGKLAFVSGGTSGIGRAICYALAEVGVDVVFTFRSRRKTADAMVEEIQSKYGTNAEALRVDFANEKDLEMCLSETFWDRSHFSILVNNVGILHREHFLDITSKSLREVFEVNIFSAFMLSQQFCARRIQEKESSGVIVNISSLSARSPTSGVAHYQCSKSSLETLSSSIAYEMAPYGIRANTVAPGLVKTSANQDQWDRDVVKWNQRVSRIPLERSGYPEEVADAVLFLIQNSWITGSTVSIDGGQSM